MTRVLLHYDQPELFADLVADLCPTAEIALCRSYDELPAALESHRAEVLYCIKFEKRPYPRAAVLGATTLKWVSVGGAGVDHIAPWDPAKLSVTNSSGIAAEVMAFHVIGGVVALTHRLPRFLRQQVQHRWQSHLVGQVAGQTLGILGLGNTGRAVARLAAGLGLRVIGLRAHPQPTEHVERVYGSEQLLEMLAEADTVVVSTPLTERTRHLIDGRAIAAMKPGALLIDVSRGGVVDGAALLDGLNSGQVGGALLDVFEREPLAADSPVWDLENVIVTPHSSSVYEGWERRSAEMFCANLDRWQAGQPLENLVDPARGY